jgi:hypothetical protein
VDRGALDPALAQSLSDRQRRGDRLVFAESTVNWQVPRRCALGEYEGNWMAEHQPDSNSGDTHTPAIALRRSEIANTYDHA